MAPKGSYQAETTSVIDIIIRLIGFCFLLKGVSEQILVPSLSLWEHILCGRVLSDRYFYLLFLVNMFAIFKQI